jgi:hypothetical protein
MVRKLGEIIVESAKMLIVLDSFVPTWVACLDSEEIEGNVVGHVKDANQQYPVDDSYQRVVKRCPAF